MVFEDVPAGIRSGKAAGARVIALQTTMTAAALKQAREDWVVENCGAIQLSRDKDKLVLTFEPVAT